MFQVSLACSVHQGETGLFSLSIKVKSIVLFTVYSTLQIDASLLQNYSAPRRTHCRILDFPLDTLRCAWHEIGAACSAR